MEANPRALKNIFESQTRFLVPLYQRPYVWKRKEQWEPLWQDIENIAERYLSQAEFRPHFMGAIVLEQIKTVTGALDARQIIDGQQRLTTLQLFIGAARDVCKLIGTVADNHFSRFNYLISNPGESTDSDDIFKVWPTNVDRAHFRRVMTAGSPEQVRERYAIADQSIDLGHPIPEAYLYFFDTIKNWLNPEDSSGLSRRLTALQDTVYRGLIAVVIDLDEKDNAQVIFETLNARGTPLLAADLVKNFLLLRAEAEDLPIERLYDRYWFPFDEDDRKFWRVEISQGRLNRPRIEVFLQHYLTMTLKEEVAANTLFVTFRERVEKGRLSSESYLADLHHYGSIFRSFYGFPTDTPEGLFFYRIDKLDTTTLFPFLLFLFDRLSKPSELAERSQILTDLESFLIRRLICGLTTKNYNRFFTDLQNHIDSYPGDLRTTMLSYFSTHQGDSERWPDDVEFSKAWETIPLYRRITRSRLRMILEALEVAIPDPLAENRSLPNKLTVEHLLPQEWETHWPLDSDDPDEIERRNVLLHTIGNLTLVTGKLNSTLQNGPWETKRDHILKHSGLALNRSFLDIYDWNEDRIHKRSNKLFEVARTIWPYPGENTGSAG